MDGQTVRHTSTAGILRALGASVAGVCVASVVVTGVASAQSATDRGYVFGGVMRNRQSGATGEIRVTYLTAPGGWTTGWTVGAGVRVARRASIEGEFAATGVMKAREPSRYDITYNEERRDLFFGANVRMLAARASRVQFEPVIGAALIKHQAWSQNEYARYTGTLPVVVTVDPRQAKDLPMSLGVSAGLDARIGGPRLSLVPSLRIHRRVHRLNGDNDFDWWYPNGMPAWTFSAGASLRLAF